MSDVRLTATNPEDSSVVLVACNAKGEIKLEAPIEPPPFDGNLDGNLNVTGSATFGGGVEGLYFTADRNSGVNTILQGYLNSSETSKITADGSATFAGGNTEITSDGLLKVKRSIGNGAGGLQIFPDNNFNRKTAAAINTDGSATFAGGKAGFTSEGYLWCTTQRGDTVILEFTTNGLATWTDYTPQRKLVSTTDIDDLRLPRD